MLDVTLEEGELDATASVNVMSAGSLRPMSPLDVETMSTNDVGAAAAIDGVLEAVVRALQTSTVGQQVSPRREQVCNAACIRACV